MQISFTNYLYILKRCSLMISHFIKWVEQFNHMLRCLPAKAVVVLHFKAIRNNHLACYIISRLLIFLIHYIY